MFTKTLTDINQDILQLDSVIQNSARRLLKHAINETAVFIISNPKYVLTPKELLTYNQGIEKLQNGMPLAYIVGKETFWSLDFVVNEHTLIPRPDTEIIVKQALRCAEALASEYGPALHVLDLGTGTGAIAVALKHEQPEWQITATDISVEALAVAKTNAEHNSTSIHFLQGNWFGALAESADNGLLEKFHIIVSNPPYIAEDDEHLPALKDEPMSALVATNNGLADIETIVNEAKQYLHVGGWLLIEHGYNQAQEVQALFTQEDFKQVATIKDFGDNDRVTIGKLV